MEIHFPVRQEDLNLHKLVIADHHVTAQSLDLIVFALMGLECVLARIDAVFHECINKPFSVFSKIEVVELIC